MAVDSVYSMPVFRRPGGGRGVSNDTVADCVECRGIGQVDANHGYRRAHSHREGRTVAISLRASCPIRRHGWPPAESVMPVSPGAARL